MNTCARVRLAIFFFAPIAVTFAPVGTGAAGDVFTPVIGSTLSPETQVVRGGKVVGIRNDLDDQKPGKLPDPNTVSIDTVKGNHVVLDIGGGYFAFYAHLQKNSVPVRVGDQVKKGAVLGKLGNSGNTSGPHLHFHIMTGPSVLGSNGVPYVIDTFNLAG